MLRLVAACCLGACLLCQGAFAQPFTGSLTGAPTTQGGTMNFGTQNVGTAGAPQAETLTAHLVPGPVPPGNVVQIKSIATGSSEFAVTGGTCAGALLPDGSSCTLQIIFQPATAGARSTALSIQCAVTAVVGVVSFACDDAVHQFMALAGIGAVAAANPIPAAGRGALTLLAAALAAASWYALRRRRS
jgi:hypothetical protein